MARRIPGEFVPLDVHYTRDPAIRRAGLAAEALFVRSLAHVRLHETGGFVADFDLSALAFGIRRASEAAAALVREGLWEKVDGGWRIRSWDKWNGSKAEVNAEKEAQKAAAIKTNHERWHVDSGKTDNRCPHCKAVATDIASEIATESQKEKESKKEREKEKESKSVATDVGPRSAGGADAPTQTLIAEWIDHCTDRPPTRVIGQLSKEIKALLTEGIPYEHVRAGVAAWARKGLHPSTLASVVHETRNPAARTDKQADILRAEMERAQASDATQARQIGA